MIDLYTLPTPNGQKASIMLEEVGAKYNVHRIDITKGDQFTPSYLKISPNGKIPSIVDQDGPDGQPLTIMESGAILIYLADKYKMLLPDEPHLRSKVLQWLFFQVGHIGPMFGQFGHFYKYAREKCDHPYPLERYSNEVKRLLGVIERQLESTHDSIAGAFSIADIAMVPWINCLDEFYHAADYLGISQFPNVEAWRERFNRRPGVMRGRTVGSE